MTHHEQANTTELMQMVYDDAFQAMMVSSSGLPPLANFNQTKQAVIMSERLDCPIDYDVLGALPSHLRAAVMASRLDCIVDYTGLNDGQRVDVSRCREYSIRVRAA